MAADVVQTVTASTSSGSFLSYTLPGVTAGNGIAAGAMCDQATLVTWAATDDVDSTTYTNHGTNYANSDRSVSAHTYSNSSGGDVQITMTPSATRRFASDGREIGGAGTSLAVTYAENKNGGTNPKYAAPATGFSPPADSVAIAWFTFNAATLGNTPGSGWTVGYNSSVNPLGLSEHQAFSSAQTNLRPDCSTTTAARQGPACCIFIEAGTAAPSGPPVGTLAMMGVGR